MTGTSAIGRLDAAWHKHHLRLEEQKIDQEQLAGCDRVRAAPDLAHR
jgi:hypothetical protein